MFTAHPIPRLRHAEISQQITLVDLTGPRKYIVQSIRDDGYYELKTDGRATAIASPGHEIKELKCLPKCY